MCMSNKSGPQLYSGSGPAVPNPGNSAGNDGSDDTDGNSFRSIAYHDKLRDDAASRKRSGDLRFGKPNPSKKKSLYSSMFG